MRRAEEEAAELAERAAAEALAALNSYFHLGGAVIGGGGVRGATIGEAVIGGRLLARKIRPGDYELLRGEEVVGTVHIDFNGPRGRLLAGWNYPITAAEFEAMWRDNKINRIEIAHQVGVDESHTRRLAKDLGLPPRVRGRKKRGGRF